MTRDEQLILQVLKAYQNEQIDFSQVPALEALIREQVKKEWQNYKQKLDAHAEGKINTSIQQTQDQIQSELELESFKQKILSDIQVEQEKLERLKVELTEQHEQMIKDKQKLKLENWSTLVINIACLLCFLVVCVLLGRWIYQGIWNGWGLHLLWDTIFKMRTDHPYGALVLGIIGFGFIAAAIYASFQLIYKASTSWFDQRPKLFKKIFPKK